MWTRHQLSSGTNELMSVANTRLGSITMFATHAPGLFCIKDCGKYCKTLKFRQKLGHVEQTLQFCQSTGNLLWSTTESYSVCGACARVSNPGMQADSCQCSRVRCICDDSGHVGGQGLARNARHLPPGHSHLQLLSSPCRRGHDFFLTSRLLCMVAEAWSMLVHLQQWRFVLCASPTRRPWVRTK